MECRRLLEVMQGLDIANLATEVRLLDLINASLQIFRELISYNYAEKYSLPGVAT